MCGVRKGWPGKEEWPVGLGRLGYKWSIKFVLKVLENFCGDAFFFFFLNHGLGLA